MQLESLFLSNFRNITEASFTPHPELTLICGNNGQGKTNLLEAIWLFTGGKSFRANKDQELIQKDKPFSILTAEFTKREQNETTDLFLPQEQSFDAQLKETVSEEPLQKNTVRITISGLKSERPGRQAKKNNVSLGRATNLIGFYPAVVFAPNHLSLIKGSPEGRRKFIDAALCQLYPNYITIYRRYIRAMTQKNACLKQYYKLQADQKNIASLLDVYDMELAKQGEEIQKRRLDYLTSLTVFAKQNYQEISSGAETLSIRYQSQFIPGGMAEKLKEFREREYQAGCCLVGPHREDFEITLNGELAKIYASQGQQRSAVLSLKLAEASVSYSITGIFPAILLDDVLSELDESRKKYLLTRVQGKQVFITSCEESSFSKTNGKIVYMEKGVLKEL